MRTEKLVIVLLIAALAVASDSLAGPGMKTIGTPELHSMVVDNAYMLEKGREQKFIIIDSRMKKDFDKAHIFSAISIPEKELPGSMDLLPKDKGVLLVVYCSDRQLETSRKWAVKATAAGYANIAVYAEGFPAWKEKKMPVVSLGY